MLLGPDYHGASANRQPGAKKIKSSRRPLPPILPVASTNFRSFLALVRAKIWQVETARREKNPMWTVGGGIIIAVIVLAALPLILWDIVFLIVPISDEPTHHQHPNHANQGTQKAPQLAGRVSAISATTNH